MTLYGSGARYGRRLRWWERILRCLTKKGWR